MRFTSLRLIGSLAYIIFTFFGGQSLYAEEGIMVQPAIIDVPVSQPTVSQTIHIKNLYNQPVAIEVLVRSLSPNDTVVNNSSYRDARNLLLLSEKQFILEPLQEKEYSLEINKQDLPAGVGSYATVVFRAKGFAAFTGNGLAVNTEIAVPVLISTAGQPVRQLTAEILDSPRFIIGDKPEFSIALENKGSIHERPIVTFELLDIDGVVKFSESRTENLLLPGTRRLVDWQPTDRLSSGRYVLRLRLTYGTQKEFVTESATLYRIPQLRYLVLCLLLIISLGTYVLIVRRRKNLPDKHKQATMD